MDFPIYVPAAVRLDVIKMIKGDRWETTGLELSLARAENQLVEIERAVQIKIESGEEEYLFSLRRQATEAKADRDRLADDLNCILRLAQDPRMEDAYILMSRNISNDQKICNFIYSAWSARIDYSKYRNRLRNAIELNAEIEKVADKLANLIDEFSQISVNGPSEFYDIPELLRKTDNHELRGRNLYFWRLMRPNVLGDIRKDKNTNVPEINEANIIADLNIKFIDPNKKIEIDLIEQERNTFLYAWSCAPNFSALLKTVSRTAKNFRPSETGMIGAAIGNRQSNIKREYLRAFGNLLTEQHGFKFTLSILHAIAIVANVAINLPGIDVTYDDVRKTLNTEDGSHLNSSENN